MKKPDKYFSRTTFVSRQFNIILNEIEYNKQFEKTLKVRKMTDAEKRKYGISS